MKRQSGLRTGAFTIATAALVVTFCGLRLWLWQGMIFPVRIAGGSMAPALIGDHYLIVCNECDFTFPCDSFPLPRTGYAVCPNCGSSQNAQTPQTVQRGQRVVVDRLDFHLRRPRRWEIAALRDERGNLVVKRIVGLPGERVGIRDGDLYINGRIARKRLEEFRKMAILVHDDRFRPTATETLPPRWRSERADSSWLITERGYARTESLARLPHEALLEQTDPADWLQYRNWRCYAGLSNRSNETPMRDNYGYNQGVCRDPCPASDLLFACRVPLPPQTIIQFRIHDGYEVFHVTLEGEGPSVLVNRGDHRFAESQRYGPRGGRERLVEIGLFDQQCVVAIDQRIVLLQEYERKDTPARPTPRPLAIAMERGNVTVSDLRIFRDVYYLTPNGRDGIWQLDQDLGVGEYFLLGDNPPVSVDSRQWERPGLRRDNLLGPVTEYAGRRLKYR